MVLPCLEYFPLLLDCLEIVSNIHDAREANVDALHNDTALEKLQACRNKQTLTYMYKQSRNEENLI